MSCRNLYEEMRNLQRCGCDRCYSKYRVLNEERSIYRYPSMDRDLARPLTLGMDYGSVPAFKLNLLNSIPTGGQPVIETKKLDPAISAILSRRSSVQATLNNQKQTVTSRKDSVKRLLAEIKTYGPSIKDGETELALLNKALKKLGHEEA